MEEIGSSRLISLSALFLSLIMLVSLFVSIVFTGPATAVASGDYEYELINGDTEVKITSYTGPGGDVVIPELIDGRPVTMIDWHAFYQMESVTSVTLPSSLGGVSSMAFQECWNLTAIYVDSNSTQFASLDGVLFSKNLGALVMYPPGLEGGYDVPGTTDSIGYEAFVYCSKITSITIPDSVTFIQQKAFYSCTSLSSVTLGSGISAISDWTFAYCRALESITIPDSVNTIGNSAFIVCDSLSSLTIGTGTSSIGVNAFYFCSSLAALEIPGNVLTIGASAFSGCASLSSLTLNEGLSTIGNYAFTSCTSLTSVDIPGSVASMADRTFSGCWSMTSINVDPSNTVYESAGGVLFNEDLTRLIKYPCGLGGSYNVPDSVTALGDAAFSSCPELSRVRIGENVTDIPIWALSYDRNLTEIEVDPGNPIYSSLDGVLFDKDVTELLQYPSGKAGAYVFPNTVTSLRDWSMAYAQSLTSVTIPEGVTYIGEGAFSECPTLTEINIPGSVTFIGEWAFDECYALLEINVDEGGVNYSSMDGALFNANRTILIKVPSGWTGAYDIPDGVVTIGDWAINACNLTHIIVPGSVAYLGYRSFCDLPALEVLRFNGDAPDTDINWKHMLNGSLVVQYYLGAANFTSPTWNGIASMALSVPSSPLLVSATAEGTVVTLTWTSPENDGNLSITGYTVFYGTVSPDAQFGGTLSNTSTSATVTGLDPGVKYFFAVKAVNDLGNSPLSNVLNVTVPSENDGSDGQTLMIAIVVVVIVAAAALGVWWFKLRK